jgi:adenylosuccinate lyase
MLGKAIFVIRDLNVLESNMKRNLMKYGGIIFSQRVLLELINRGMDRQDAYAIIQSAAHKAWSEEGSFKENIEKEEKVKSLLGSEELEELFDVRYHLRYVDTIIGRLEGLKT